MAVPTSYLTSTKNLSNILAAVQKASVPSKFTYDFLKKLGYPSSNDRPLIPLLKAMRFIDASGTPLDRYRAFRDANQSRAVMAEGMREAYSDVFGVNQQAQKLSREELKGIFNRLSGKSESVAYKMASTFKVLATHADFTAPPTADGARPEAEAQLEPEAQPEAESADRQLEERELPPLRLHHDIHVHLPVSNEIAVYDAIFRALRQNFGE